jgi:hypothetical protein
VRQTGSDGGQHLLNPLPPDGHTLYFLSRECFVTDTVWLERILLSELSNKSLSFNKREYGIISCPQDCIEYLELNSDGTRLMGMTRSDACMLNIVPGLEYHCDFEVDGYLLACDIFLVSIQSYNFFVVRQDLKKCPLVLLYGATRKQQVS